MLALYFQDHLSIKLFDVLAHYLEHFSPFWGEPIVLSCALPAFRICLALKPSDALHPVQQRVQRPRADLISMSSQFIDHPLPMQRHFSCMMQNVRFPEAQQNLSLKLFHSMCVGYRY